MQKQQKQDLLEKWQILGLSFMMMSKTPEDFHDLVKQEFGYIWDGKGWIKEVQYQWENNNKGYGGIVWLQ